MYRRLVHRVVEIREQDPLKQGLKLDGQYVKCEKDDYSRARSTKTRIETNASESHISC